MMWKCRCGSLESIIILSSEEVPLKVTSILSDCMLSQPKYKSNLHTVVTGYIVTVSPEVL
jgi:hypothetical protein